MAQLTVILLALAASSTDAFAPIRSLHVSSSSSSSSSPASQVLNAWSFDFSSAFAPPAASSAKIPANKKVCVITGTTSGLGKETMRSLLDDGNFYVVSACRDVEKMKQVAAEEGFDPASYTVLECDLGSFDSTRKFASKLRSTIKRPLDALVCNAALYQPALPTPRYTEDSIEQQLQVNHLSHYLLCSLLLPDVQKAKKGRMIIVGSITGNTNTVGGGAVLPFADLGELEGMKVGSKEPVAMIDGKTFNGAKAYKDSKICNMMTVLELHRRYHQSTGITFSSMYPGCIAETQLFREKREWFRKLFPLFMKYVTGGYVSQREAGDRLAQVVKDPRCEKSGVYWSWNGGARAVGYYDNTKGQVVGAGGSGGELFENAPSKEVNDPVKAKLMWDYSAKITGAVFPALKGKGASVSA